MDVGVWKVAMSSPADVSELAGLIDSGKVDPAEIVAFIGKTEGNGGANDFTRGYATLCYQLMIGQRLGLSAEEVGRRIAFVWSGGTEGVLSPHATVFTRAAAKNATGTPRLALGIGISRDVPPEEVGTVGQVNLVAETVRQAMADAGITDPANVHYVQVKGPLLTPATITDADARGARTVTRDPNGSKAFARGAMGLGVAVGLGEVGADKVAQDIIAKDMTLFSSVASTSAGGELTKCEVLLFGNSPKATSAFRIGHGVLKDAIDAAGVKAALSSAGLVPDAFGAFDPAAIVSVFAKAEASPTGRIRGRRNTMLSDADINYERHARAAVGAVIASITGDPAIFVSGGTEHQCGPGEAPIAAIVRA
jgi:cyanuric acid amidohydrolase